MPQTAAASAKGSTFRTTLEFLASEAGPVVVERVVARLSPEERDALRTVRSTDELPFALLLSLMHAVDAVWGEQQPNWAERVGGYAMESGGVQMYGGILLKSSPQELLTQRVSLFRLYYHPGNMEVVEHEAGRAVLRLVGFACLDPLFCRRQTGGLQRALELAGGEAAHARHVRCSLEGDAYCEWELRWR